MTTVLIGCRSSGDDDDDNSADAGADGVSIYDIQDGTRSAGDLVTMRSVVVVAIDGYGDSQGSIWVAETEDHPTHGRAFSGVQVFSNDLAQISGLQIGDLVDVEGGEIDEFALDCFEPMPMIDCTDNLLTLTEIGSPQGASLTITKVGEGTVPAPVVVLPQDLAADANEAEKWESVLIQFDNVAVTQAPRDVTSDTTLFEMRVTGPMLAQSALAAFPDTMRDDCYTSVTGVLTYFFDWKLLPRSSADYAEAADATGCLYETSAADCDDGADNDFDGFGDCADFSCQTENPVMCSTDGTVVQTQDGTLTENMIVNLSAVVVTAVAANGEDLWVQDAASTVDYNGVHVFRGSGAPALDASIAVGSVVNLSGVIDEFYEDTEIDVTPATQDVAFVDNSGVPAVRADVAAGALGDESAAGEPYEGMLVELTNVKVVTPDDTFGGFTVGTAGTELTIDNELFDTLPQPSAAGECYARIRGVMSYAFSDRKLYPRDAGDIETGGTCP